MDRRAVLHLIAGTGAALAVPAAAWSSPLAAIAPGDFRRVVEHLERPEGVACTSDGQVVFSTGGATYAVLGPNGALTLVGNAVHANGVALDRRGRVVIAVFGLLGGGAGPLLRHDPRTGQLETLAERINGQALVASNFPVIARDGTIYCTHSKWANPTNIGNRLDDGFVYRVTRTGMATIAARGIRGANGACLDAGERFIYVAETGAGRILRMRRGRDGTLGPAEPFGPVLGEVVAGHDIADIRRMDPALRARLGYPDGMAFDADGNLWVTLPFANRIVAITPDERVIGITSDPAGAMIGMPTNLAWGGPDLRTLYVVSRASGAIVSARTAVPGLALPHWR